MFLLSSLLLLVNIVPGHSPEHTAVSEDTAIDTSDDAHHQDSEDKHSSEIFGTVTDLNKLDHEIHDENHPLVTIIATKPHSMTLMVKPKNYHPNTMVRLLYERVPHRHKADMEYLDDPVIEYMPLIRRVQNYDLTELPKGKYIVCGEAMVHGEVYQASCFETMIERLDNNSE